MAVTDYLVPLLLLGLSAMALGRGVNSYHAMLRGAEEGLRIAGTILPSLVVLMTAVSMFRVSGGVELLSRFLGPVLGAFGIPGECTMLLLIRPISGSAALAVGAEIMASCGVDSPVGRTAAVMLGSTETTFYVLSVYFGAAGIPKSRYTLPAALIADLTGFIAASWSVRFFFR